MRDFHRILHDTETHTVFGEKIVTEKTKIMELKSIYGISNIRDITTTSGSGTVTNDNKEFNLKTTASGSDKAVLDSAEKGRYVPGSVAEAGIGVRIPNTSLSGDQVARWGYFDDNDGFYFGMDSGGLFVGVRKGGSEIHKTYQDNWNCDKLNGSDESNISISPADGHIYQIRFTWYGYGGAEFTISSIDSNNSNLQTESKAHRFPPTDVEDVSVDNPNLPLRAELDNGGTASAADLFVAGRQFSIVGKYEPNTRISANRRLQQTVNSTSFVPVMSIRRKSGFGDVSVKFQGLDIISTDNLAYQIRTGTSLSTSASFGALTDVSTGETSLEANTDSTNSSGGEFLYEGLLGASGSGNNRLGNTSNNNFQFDLINSDNATLLVRPVGSTSATVDSVLRLAEEW